LVSSEAPSASASFCTIASGSQWTIDHPLTEEEELLGGGVPIVIAKPAVPSSGNFSSFSVGGNNQVGLGWVCTFQRTGASTS
jgi:hypothetical protein